MKALEALYWLRFFLGIVAALISTGYGLATKTIVKGYSPNVFINGFAWAVIVYTISYYIIKPRLLLKVEKQQKILTTGIFSYFLSWLVFWILFYTIISAA